MHEIGEIAEAQERLTHRAAHRKAPARRPPQTLEEAIGEAMAAAAWVSDAEVAEYERDRERQRRFDRLWDSGVADVLTPEMVEALVSDTLTMTEALAWTRKWLAYQHAKTQPKGPRPMLALVGDMGRGKTVAAAWLVLHAGARYIEADEVCRIASAKFGPEVEEWRRLQRARALVIDEVGTEENPAQAAAAYRILLNRRQGERLTLLLGNITRADLKARLDARTWDRMRERALVVELEGDSMRRGEP